MNCKPRLLNMRFFRALRSLYSQLTRVTILALSTLIVGCSLQGFEQTSRYAETKFTLDSANFETETVHAVGEASCFYILFSIPVCKNQNIATVARQEIRLEAKMEGKSAQLFDVLEDHSIRWNFFYIFFLEYFSVSANVIVYQPPIPEQVHEYPGLQKL